MEKMKRFIDCVIPVTTCNLRCHYCYITLGKWSLDKHYDFRYSAEHIGKALSVERLGGLCYLNMCGLGETLIPPETIDIIRSLLEQGHYIMVVTNGTITKRFDEIINFPKDLLKRLGFKFSFHYLELIRTKRIDIFFNNVQRVRDAGCSISIELTPNDEVIPYIDDIKNVCKEKVGAVCHVTVGRNEANPEKPILTKYSKSEYEDYWGVFNSALFRFKMATFGIKRKEYCYAGDWSAVLNLGTGQLKQCYKTNFTQNIFDDISKPINFTAIGKHCLEPHCYNSHVFMTLGVIPSIQTPFYSDMRNRNCADGSEWLKGPMKEFFSSKLCESNTEYNSFLDTFVKRRDQYGAMICSYLGLRPVHLLTQLPGNTGDHLIWAGTEDLLKSNGIGFSEISVSDFGSGKCLGNTLVIPGSGALTKRYHEWLPALILVASKKFNRVVVLPSGYDASVPIVAEALSRPNVFAFAREPRSYREIKPFGRAALAMDPALYFSDFRDLSLGSIPGVYSTNRLVCLREDLGSPLPERGYKPNPKYNNDISLTSVGLDEFLQKIRAAELVITDRLHVAVAAVMSGKQIQYLDPYDGKISNYFSFVFRETFEHLAVPCTIEWLQKHDFIIPKGSE